MTYIGPAARLARKPHALVAAYISAIFRDADFEDGSVKNSIMKAIHDYRKIVETLSVCCGAQMAPSYRRWLHGSPDANSAGRHECDLVDLSKLENELVKSKVYNKCSGIDVIEKLSEHDGVFTGDYCTRARHATVKGKLAANAVQYSEL